MRIYRVYETSNSELDVVPIKEGFNWVAFLCPLLWALFHRMWLLTLIILMANVCIGLFLTKFGGDEVVLFTVFMCVATIIGWTANDFRVQALTNSGYRLVAILLANNMEGAIERYTLEASNLTTNKRYNRAGGPW